MRFKNAAKLFRKRDHPCSELVEACPLSVPFVGDDSKIRRVGEDEVDRVVRDLLQEFQGIAEGDGVE